MTYFGVKNQFLLQQGSVNLGKGRGRVEDCELRGREREEAVGRRDSEGGVKWPLAALLLYGKQFRGYLAQ